MDLLDFVKIKENFKKSDTNTKINIYCFAEGLSTLQYKELLALFPMQELHKLEEALSRL